MVASILGLGALFLRSLFGSFFHLNISATCLSACSFVAPMGANGVSGAGLARASTRYKAVLVAASFGYIQGIFV